MHTLSTRITAILILVLGISGCGGSILKRLNPSEKDHYVALQVWMSDDDKKDYKRLKTEEERNQFLKDKGFWNRFYEYEPALRDKIVAGEVTTGWSQDMVYMAWGAPHQKRVMPGRRASRSVMLVYRFEVDQDGRTMVWVPNSKATYKAISKFQLEVVCDDLTVTEIRKKDRWE